MELDAAVVSRGWMQRWRRGPGRSGAVTLWRSDVAAVGVGSGEGGDLI